MRNVESGGSARRGKIVSESENEIENLLVTPLTRYFSPIRIRTLSGSPLVIRTAQRNDLILPMILLPQ